MKAGGKAGRQEELAKHMHPGQREEDRCLQEEAGDLGGIVLHRGPHFGCVPCLHSGHFKGPRVGLVLHLRPVTNTRKTGACKRREATSAAFLSSVDRIT